MKTTQKWLVLLALMAFGISACAAPVGANTLASDINRRQVLVVTTTSMITDIVQQVGGERVQVTGLMGAGIDPHQFKASAGNVLAMERADIIFFNGLHLEAGMANVLERMDEQRNVIAVTDGIDVRLLKTSEDFGNNYDPHVWFDVSLWMKAVEQVRDSLAAIDPDNAFIYEANAEAYLEDLEELHEYVIEQANRIPVEQRVLITAHDAFNYFGSAYGFEVKGLQGISTATEASTSDVQELVIFIVERQIPAIFIETSVPRRNVEAVQAAVQARGYTVEIGGELFSDAMGNPGTPEGTYIGMVRHNIDTIVKALLGE